MSVKYKSFFVVFLSLLLLTSLSFPQDFESLYNLSKNKDFFTFRNKVKYYSNPDIPWQEIYLQAMENNIFGNYEYSNNKLKILLNNHHSQIPDSIVSDIYEIKASNHLNLFEYKSAYETALLLNSDYSSYLDSREKENTENELIIWNALQNVPPQKILKSGDVKIPLIKDFAGLWNIPVKIKNNSYEFIFDTGANFCVIVESLAKKNGLMIIENAKFEVETATDKKIVSKIGFAKHIKLGDISAENVIFIVMPDESLDFGVYKIDGIIGNPVLKAFGQIIINNENEIVIPASPEKSSLKNLAFDGFTPVIQMINKNDSLCFTFDSGGQATCLYKPFFLKYKDEVTGKYKLVKIKIGGAGGSKSLYGYILDKIVLKTGNAKSEIQDVKLLKDLIKEKDEYFYGNLGQDYFKEFSKIIINYSDMYIEFVK